MQPTEFDATSMATGVHHGTFSARQLVDMTLRCIDETEPAVNAFRVVTRAEAIAAARAIDDLPAGDRRSLPLAGVPVAIKDDTDVAGHSTMWGTTVDRGRCAEDAAVVARLRHAGAIVVGKTNVPELTLWPWTSTAVHGAVRNPWNLERTPGGSSGGSAAAVCSGMAAMAVGSDGGGSIRYPAGLTGLVGLKPQRGRLPLGPEHGSGWHGLVAVGSLTRSVRDAELFLRVTADAAAPFVPSRQPGARLRVAVSANPPPGSQVSLSRRVHAILDDAAALLAELGHETVKVDLDYGLASLWNSTVRYLKGVRDDVASLPASSSLERRTRHVARIGSTIPNPLLRRALAREAHVAASINAVFADADVVMTPLCESQAPLIVDCPERGAVRSLRASNTSAWLVPWNVTGQPALSVPTGIDGRGLPTAVHLAGRTDDEATLLDLAAQIESARPFASPVR